MTLLKACPIKSSDIDRACVAGDVDAAALVIQDAAGITDGGIADLCLSHLAEGWCNLTASERREHLLRWLAYEAVMAASRPSSRIAQRFRAEMKRREAFKGPREV